MANTRKERGIWYKDITNSSILYLDLPKTMSCKVALNNNDILEPNGNRLEYKLGQTIYSLKDKTTSMLDYFTAFVIMDVGFYPISDIYYKEIFLGDPVMMFPNLGQFVWNPKRFIGDSDARLRLDVLNENSVIVYTKELTTKSEQSSIQLNEGYYSYKITLLGRGFLHKETVLYNKNFVYGNEKNLKYKGITLP
jgi:hypothetical protein